MPGPGNYNINDLSRKNHAPSFGHAKRSHLDEFNSEKVPGPGSYQIPVAPSNMLNAPKIR